MRRRTHGRPRGRGGTPSACLSATRDSDAIVSTEAFHWLPDQERALAEFQRMRRMVEAAGFRVEAQRRIYRIPAGLVLPPVLTTAVKGG